MRAHQEHQIWKELVSSSGFPGGARGKELTCPELPNLAVAERPRPWCQGLYRSTPLLKNLSLHGFPKQPSVPWKSKGQNPELWPAGPALLLALCRPAGPGAPTGMGKRRVHGLHPRNLVGCMDFKPWWPPRQQRRHYLLSTYLCIYACIYSSIHPPI